MAVSNATINRLGQLSSILNTVGGAVVDNMQINSDKKLQNASSLINTYYTDTNTGRVAQTINSSTRENLQENMQKLQKEIGELDTATAKQKITGLGDFDDAYIANALNTFKGSAGTYLASSYIQGQSALEQQYKSNAFTAFDNYFSSAYSNYATEAKELGDITNANENFDRIFDEGTVDKMIAGGYIPASYKEDYEAFLEEYKGQYGEQWKAKGVLYTNAMQNSQILTDFSNGLNADFILNHADSTFAKKTTETVTGEDGNTEEVEKTTYNVTDGESSWNEAVALYDSRYLTSGAGIADPNGLRKSGTKTGDTAIWTYLSDSYLYNLGKYSATNPEWTTGFMEDTLREWAESALSQSTSLSADEKEALIDDFISSNIDSDGSVKDGSVIATGIAETSKESNKKIYQFWTDVDEGKILNGSGALVGENVLAEMKAYGIDIENNAYERQLATNYISTLLGFTVESTDIAYVDELFSLKNEIATIEHSSFATDDAETFNKGTDDEFTTVYGRQIKEVYQEYITKNGITDSEEYKAGFFKAMNNAIISGQMSLSNTTSEALKTEAKNMSKDEYNRYCYLLYQDGTIPSNYALDQAMSLYPETNYKSTQTTVEAMLKQSLGDTGIDGISDFYMTGVYNYLGVKEEISEQLDKYDGDIESEGFKSWLQTYTANLISAYSEEFASKEFDKIFSGLKDYDANSTEVVSALGADATKLLSDYKRGDYDGIINNDAISNAMVAFETNDNQPDYDDLCESLYQTLYPSRGKYKDATDAQKANVLLNLEVATLLYEETERVEKTFGDVIPVYYAENKQAYIRKSDGLVIRIENNYSDEYRLSKLVNAKPEDYELYGSEATMNTLLSENMGGDAEFKRTVYTRGLTDNEVREAIYGKEGEVKGSGFNLYGDVPKGTNIRNSTTKSWYTPRTAKNTTAGLTVAEMEEKNRLKNKTKTEAYSLTADPAYQYAIQSIGGLN